MDLAKEDARILKVVEMIRVIRNQAGIVVDLAKEDAGMGQVSETKPVIQIVPSWEHLANENLREGKIELRMVI